MFFFFFNYTATTEIYTYRHTLSLHDALPICAKTPEDGQRLHRRPRCEHPGIGGDMVRAHLGKHIHRAAERELVDAGIDHAPHGDEDEEAEREASDAQVDRGQEEAQSDRDRKRGG